MPGRRRCIAASPGQNGRIGVAASRSRWSHTSHSTIGMTAKQCWKVSERRQISTIDSVVGQKIPSTTSDAGRDRDERCQRLQHAASRRERAGPVVRCAWPGSPHGARRERRRAIQQAIEGRQIPLPGIVSEDARPARAAESRLRVRGPAAPEPCAQTPAADSATSNSRPGTPRDARHRRGRDDHGPGHGHRLEHLVLDAARNPQRRHHGRSVLQIGTHVRHRAGHDDAWPRGQRRDGRRGVHADDVEARVRALGEYCAAAPPMANQMTASMFGQ